MKNYKHLDELHQQYRQKKGKIRRRLQEYRAVPEKQYFYELLYCLMTPQSSAVNAAKAQRQFEAVNYKRNNVDPEPLLYQEEYYIRFHRTKARWITSMKKNFSSIHRVTCSSIPAAEKREWLAENVLGMSYKEATHFLRNIGKNDQLAILDRHILKNLRRYGIIRTVPKTITRKEYLLIEKKIQRFAEQIGISVNELDLLFWSKETGEILK